MREHLLNLLACLAVFAVLPLAGCSKPPELPEPIPEPGPVPLNSFVRGWASTLDLPAGDHVKAIHAREDKVFAYTTAGQIIVMSRDSGKLLWAAHIRATDRGGMRPPVVMTGTISVQADATAAPLQVKNAIVIPTSSTLEIYEPEEGKFIKSVSLQVATRSDAIALGNLVFLGGDFQGSGRVVAIDISKPYSTTAWQLMISKGGLSSTPALFDNKLFIGGGNGEVYAVGPASREALWNLKDNAFKTEGPIAGDLAADAEGVYAASTDSRLYCLSPATGRLKWQYYGGVALQKGPTVAGAQVFQPVPGAGIAVIAKGDTGAFNRGALWTAVGMTEFLADDEKLVYLRRDGDNAIVAFDKQTGEQRFESNRRDLVAFGANHKGDGMIFAASKTNRVIAIKPVMRPGVVGELVWNDLDPAEAAVSMSH